MARLQILPPFELRPSDLQKEILLNGERELVGDPAQMARVLRLFYQTIAKAFQDEQKRFDLDPRWSQDRRTKSLHGMGHDVTYLHNPNNAAGDIAYLVDPYHFSFGSAANKGSGGSTPTAVVHPLLDGVYDSDTLAASVTRGALIAGNSTPKWAKLAGPVAAAVLVSDGLDVMWKIGSYQNKLLDGLNHTDTDGAALPTKGDMIINSGSLWTVVSLLAQPDIFLRQSTGGLPQWQEGLAKSGIAVVDLANQGANIATTNLVAASNTRGIYRVSVVAMDTTADVAAGTLQVTIGWTDDAGATTQNAFTTPLTLTALGRAAGVVTLYSSGPAAITYGATVTGIFGSSKYSLRIRTEFVG